MFRKLQVAAALMCTLSYAAAGTNSIGTASARGDMHVDSYLVKGNATLFDGSVVETGLASANLHLNRGAELTMSTSSSGTLYSDHLVLQQGKTQLAGSGSFQLEANGLRVSANAPNSLGTVSVTADKTVEVASLTGSFAVTNGRSIVLANVLPGHVVSFAMQAGADPNSFNGTGLVSFESGAYYLTTAENGKYVLTCIDSHKYVGTKVVVTGTLQPGGAGFPSALCVKSMSINGGSSDKKWLIAGLLMVGAGVGTAIGIVESNQSGNGASR